MERVILHSDLNNCYASIECMLHPELRGKYIAVCGSTEERHGIVLAKNQLAKQCGVKTGDVIWEARQKCPQLTIVPPHMDQYLKFSKLVRSIYLRYSPEVESFGIDESWISLTGSPLLKNRTPVEIANEIRETVKAEVGLTVSIGVSFNKIFAKLGSDMKKPDAVTEIRPDTFREQVWPLPASDLLYVGRATEEKLRRYCIHTIGDLAQTDKDFLIRLLGVNGEKLWSYANGLDSSRVMPCDYELPIKSIGHGITCTEDLVSEYEVRCVFRELSQEVGLKLRKNKLAAMGVRIAVRDNILSYAECLTIRVSHSRPEVGAAGDNGYGMIAAEDLIAYLTAGRDHFTVGQTDCNNPVIVVNDLNDVIHIDHPIFKNNKTTHIKYLLFCTQAKDKVDAGPEPWPLLRAGI